MMRTRAELQAAVVNGVALLDLSETPGWRDRINVPGLNMASGDACVLGQLHGTYQNGCDALFGRSAVRIRRVAEANGFFGSRDEYPILDQLWSVEILRSSPSVPEEPRPEPGWAPAEPVRCESDDTQSSRLGT